MTPAGALPLSFELQADSLAQAAEKFADGANNAMEDAVKRLEELRREQVVVNYRSGCWWRFPGGGAQYVTDRITRE